MLTDAELLALTTEFRAGILGDRPSTNMCAIVCYPLEGYLSFLGVDVTLQHGDPVRQRDHVWLALPDGRVLDPTADQFDASLGPVYLGPRLAMHRYTRRGKQRHPLVPVR
jgi:hypothetical protein